MLEKFNKRMHYLGKKSTIRALSLNNVYFGVFKFSESIKNERKYETL